MTEKQVDDQKRIEEETNSSPAVPSGARTSPLLKGFLLILVLIISAGASYRAGLLEPWIRWAKSYQASGKATTVLSGLPVWDLLSSHNELTVVGKTPVDPSEVLLPSKSDGTGSTDSAKSCPPELFRAQSQEGEVTTRGAIVAGSVALPENKSESSKKDFAEAPTIVTRKPSETEPGGKETGKERSILPASAASEAHKAAAREEADSLDQLPTNHKPDKATQKEQRAAKPENNPPPIPKNLKKKSTGSHQPKTNRSDVAVVPTPESGSSDTAKSDRYQLPGAMLVKIASYEGSLTKWGIMVILDDAASMAKKVKPWSPNRSRAAVTLVEKLPEIMTPGSKMAVRDFLCRKSASKKKGRPCLSHMLYDWSDSPFKQLKQSLERVDPRGSNNPCAAAAFVVKRDLSGLGQLSARVLVVTNGAAKCVGVGVTKAIDRHRGSGKVALDVIALGMRQKYSRGYALLAKRTGGVFLRVNGPDDLDRTLARYKKILHKRTLERIEVRGENAVFTVTPGKEITLAPGSYSVVLPLVENLKESKRKITNVTVKSGETKVLQVRIKKGRPVVRFAKK